MKILFLVHQFYPSFASGTETVTLNIARMAQMGGHRVRVVTYQPTYQIENAQEYGGRVIFSDRMYATLPVTEFCLKQPPEDVDYGIGNQDTVAFARMILDREQPDIIHVMHFMRVNPFLIAARERGIPYIVTLTDFWTICPRVNLSDKKGQACSGNQHGTLCAARCHDPVDYLQRYRQAKELLENATLIAAPSEYVRKIIQAEMGLKVEVFAHGIDYTKVRFEMPDANKKKVGKLRLGFVGTLISHKGVEQLLEAFSRVRKSKLDLKLYGTGKDAYVQKLKQMARGSNIHWMGQCTKEKIMEAYQHMDALIVPSTCNETYSLAKNEALANGVPVIVSNMGALPESIENGVNGFVFDPFDPDELTGILKRINEEPIILRRMARKVQQVTVPSIEQESFRYLSVYLEVIGR